MKLPLEYLGLWECNFTLTNEYFIDKCRHYWWSTTPPTLELEQQYWNKINPSNIVSEFSSSHVSELEQEKVDQSHFQITDRIYKKESKNE